jgi:hypothetical protein
MKQILAEDASKFIPPLIQVISALGNRASKLEVEQEITIGDEAVIANVKGYWVGNLIRIDIKFRE